MSEDETYEIGYMEDGVFWLTASSGVPDAAAAERSWDRVAGGRGGLTRATGEWVNDKDPEWAECPPG